LSARFLRRCFSAQTGPRPSGRLRFDPQLSQRPFDVICRDLPRAGSTARTIPGTKTPQRVFPFGCGIGVLSSRSQSCLSRRPLATDVPAGWTAGGCWAILCWRSARWLQIHQSIEGETKEPIPGFDKRLRPSDLTGGWLFPWLTFTWRYHAVSFDVRVRSRADRRPSPRLAWIAKRWSP
jgi:hypothetical protein